MQDLLSLKNTRRLGAAMVVACLLPLVSHAQEDEGTVLAHDDFEDNSPGDPLGDAVTSDQLWHWSLHSSSGNPTIQSSNDNSYAYFASESVYSMTLQGQEGQGWLTLDTSKPHEIEFDYLYFTTWGDHQWFWVDYLLEDRYTNMGATATTDPVGLRLQLKVLNDTELQYRISQKADGSWSPIPETEGIYETSGLLNPDSETPGDPVRVNLRLLGKEQRLSFNGEEIFDLTLNTHPQNQSFVGDSYFQIWSNSGRRRGFDNFAIRQFEAPPIDIAPAELYWSNAGTIRGAELDGTDPRTAAIDLDRPIGVAIDPDGGHVYWAEDQGGRIMRAGLNGSDPIEIAALPNGSGGQQLAINTELGKLYWGDWTVGWFSANLDGSGVEELYSLLELGESSGAGTVAVNSANGDVYLGSPSGGSLVWVEAGEEDPQYLTDLGSNVYGTWVDANTNRLYFTNFGDGTLNYLDLSTLDVEMLTDGLGQPLGVVASGDGSRLYWAERTDGLIQTATINGDMLGPIETLASDEDSPFGITLRGSSAGEPGVTFASWIAGYGLGSEDSEPLSDPDGDGIKNLLEYVLGGDPTVASRSNLPVQTIESEGGTDYLTLSFSRNADAAATTFDVEHSVDLQTWESAASIVVFLVDEPDQVKVGLPLSEVNEGGHFLRLNVSAD